MNLKAELQKMDVYDLRYICKEIGVKCSLKEKKKIISYLLQPIQDIRMYRASGKSKTQKSSNETPIQPFGTPPPSPVKIRKPESPINRKRTRNNEPPEQTKRRRLTPTNLRTPSDRKHINKFLQRLGDNSTI
tara:strand:- start:74 stop:469 length:396 start_codon:yes stop_codon:yes gene_type:complete